MIAKCQYCGNAWHNQVCPLISAIEYRDDGITIKRVEFRPLQEVEWFDQPKVSTTPKDKG